MADPSRRAAVLGRPIAHSLSPVLHRAAYAALGLDWTYDAIDCDAAGLRGFLTDHPGWAGFSCTMPLKRAVLEVADEVRPVAAAVGAGNTLLPRPWGGWIADNTDVTGIVAAIRAAGVSIRTATVLGAGGTAQALVAALAELRVPALTVLVRDPARTRDLRAAGDALGVAVEVAALDLAQPALGADLVVSTLPGTAADRFARRAWTPS
ncbi:MAG: shikimate dehydrogenase, partial [Jatrophihabitantaceae bacterium]